MSLLPYYKKSEDGLCLSYSLLQDFHACPRMFQIIHLNGHRSEEQLEDESYLLGNVDFAYGHAVAGAVQSYLAYGDEEKAKFEIFRQWDIALDCEKRKKSFGSAFTAFQAFLEFKDSLEGIALEGWEVAILPNGKPAIELNFALDLNEEDCFNGHIDLVLYHPIDKRFLVLECKTTGLSYVEESTYGNSDQGTGYSTIVTALAANYPDAKHSWECLYLVYMVGSNTWRTFKFVKAPEDRLEWGMSVLADLQQIKTYQEMEFFPKRGESCRRFNRNCALYGFCNTATLLHKATKKPAMWLLHKEDLDFHSTLEAVIANTMEQIK